jgi:formylglycine-generating enzyme required for sulfatase activity
MHRVTFSSPQFMAVEKRLFFKAKSAKGVQISIVRAPVRFKAAADTLQAERTPSLPPDKAGIDWVFVEGGTFEMGDLWGDGAKDEQPVHEVTVSSFYLSKTEVTNAQFAAFINDWGKDRDENGDRMIYEYKWGLGKSGNRWTPQAGYENHPVVRVTWYGARQFAEWLGGRLPTEAEWEYAARSGGKKQKWAGTDKESELGDYAWYDKNSDEHTHPVGRKKPNGLGLYDMSGNVWEWCQDWYDEEYYKSSPTRNPSGPAEGEERVLCGGSWVNDDWDCRTVYRSRNVPGSRNIVSGFRVALSAEYSGF